MINVKQAAQYIELDLGCVPVMIIAVGTFADFRSHQMTVYQLQTLNGDGILL